MLKKQLPERSYHGTTFVTMHINKKHLAKDFLHRCAYCDDLDLYGGGYRAYQVDHFAPQTKFPKLAYDYDNLLYACPWCNRAKWDAWPSEDPTINVVGDCGFIDPCTEEYNSHLTRAEDGSINAITPLGKYIYQTLHLYLKRHEIVHNVDKLKEKIDELKASISADEDLGKDCSKKKESLKVLQDGFFRYYDLWEEVSQEIT